MEQPAYEVHLPVFDGPMDLLLHLIQQQQLDITTVALAKVTDQYLAYLAVRKEAALESPEDQERVSDELAAFLAVAARLLLIKSRALLPRPPSEEDELEDDGQDLVEQLRLYRRFKEMAEYLRDRDQESLHMYARTLPPGSQIEGWIPKLDLSGTTMDDLTSALYALLQEATEDAPELGTLVHTVTIEDKITQIRTLLRTHPQVTFRSLLGKSYSRVEVIVTFLAMLEMIRHHRIAVRQERMFGPILIVAGPELNAEPTPED
jgi:segregation and condensation protein A